ncbi:lamin tail domain-containing protein [Timonella senegalensis]|uniref:lamin tail domain-containing protein n=1 Tax=Timonella senegalensis TaxID=1465825 RepID=UPI002FDC82BD
MSTRRPVHTRLAYAAGAGALVAPLLVAPLAAAAPLNSSASLLGAASTLPTIAINEVIQNNDLIADAIELLNLGDQPVDLSGWILADDKNQMVLDQGTTIAAGQFLAITVDDDAREDKFGLGKADEASVRLPDGTVVDRFAWSGHQPTSYGRCPDGVGEFGATVTATPGAANDCTALAAGNVVINEVESSDPAGGDDWVELFNTGSQRIDLSGLVLTDSETADHRYVIPAETVIEPGGFAVLTESDFGFGLGKADSVTLFGEAKASAVVDTYSWSAHADVTFGRCPDGVGEFGATVTATPGAANDCAAVPTPLIVINEVESSGGNPGDWIELFNNSSVDVDLSGFVVRDNDDAHTAVLPAGSTIPAGGFFVVEESRLGFGLGAQDSARLFLADGHTLVAEHTWDGHADTTYGRCPDGTGAFQTTTEPTKGAANNCTGIPSEGGGDEDTPAALPWPGPAGMREFDESDTFGADMSGAVFESASVLWAVNNGNGTLHRLDVFSDRLAESTGWVGGHKLRYPDGTGTVDAEGVALVGDSSAGGVLVGSERNTGPGVPKGSRPSVLLYDVTGVTLGSELVASHEWNLAEYYPGIAPNSGIEGVAWVADEDLVAGGLIDDRTGQPYDPRSYGDHLGGVVFVGVEATGTVSGYVLGLDGSVSQVTSFESAFPGVMELEYDTMTKQLWVVCDEVCDGRSQVFSLTGTESLLRSAVARGAGVEDAGVEDAAAEVEADGGAGVFGPVALYERPAGTENLANEGFALSPEVKGGERLVIWADDGATGGHAFRAGSVTVSDVPGGGTGGGSDGGADGSTDGSTDGEGSSAGNGSDGSGTGSEGDAGGSTDGSTDGEGSTDGSGSGSGSDANGGSTDSDTSTPDADDELAVTGADAATLLAWVLGALVLIASGTALVARHRA